MHALGETHGGCAQGMDQRTGSDESQFLFPSSRGGRLSADAVQHALAKRGNSPHDVSLANKKARDTPRASAHCSDGVVPSRCGPLLNRHLAGPRVARYDPDIFGCESPVKAGRSQQSELSAQQTWPIPSRRPTVGLLENTLTPPCFMPHRNVVHSAKNREPCGIKLDAV
jgi:hypothetical protein